MSTYGLRRVRGGGRRNARAAFRRRRFVYTVIAYTVTLGLLPVSRANGLPLRVSNVADPPDPFTVIVTF